MTVDTPMAQSTRLHSAEDDASNVQSGPTEQPDY